MSSANESELAIYTLNETSGTFERLASTVDAENDTVTATTDFSTFVVFNVPQWEATFDTPLPSGRGDGATNQTLVDAMFILDSSGSMNTNDPNDLRLTGAKRVVGALTEGDRAGIVDFDSNARLTQPLTTDFAAANRSIDRIDSFGGTDVSEGLFVANEEFDRTSNIAPDSRFAGIGRNDAEAQRPEVIDIEREDVIDIAVGSENTAGVIDKGDLSVVVLSELITRPVERLPSDGEHVETLGGADRLDGGYRRRVPDLSAHECR